MRDQDTKLSIRDTSPTPWVRVCACLLSPGGRFSLSPRTLTSRSAEELKGHLWDPKDAHVHTRVSEGFQRVPSDTGKRERASGGLQEVAWPGEDREERRASRSDDVVINFY